MAFMSYDPWAGITSRNGIPGDELVAALQKAIRRADWEVAVDVAYEMYITSEQFEEKLWRRLTIIACEDIGFGNPNAIVIINNLDEARRKFPYNDGDRPFFFIHAIRFLCGQSKERSTDHIKNLVIKKFEAGYIPTIPDYAYDVHTVKGREKGRDIMHFLDEASRVTPVMEGYDDTYRQQLKEVIKKEQEEGFTPKEGSFKYNEWQQ